jgi:hypothetical protein
MVNRLRTNAEARSLNRTDLRPRFPVAEPDDEQQAGVPQDSVASSEPQQATAYTNTAITASTTTTAAMAAIGVSWRWGFGSRIRKYRSYDFTDQVFSVALRAADGTRAPADARMAAAAIDKIGVLWDRQARVDEPLDS